MHIIDTLERLQALGATRLAMSPDGERIIIEYEPTAPEPELLALARSHKAQLIQALRRAGALPLDGDWISQIAGLLGSPHPDAGKQTVEEADARNFPDTHMTQLTELTQFGFSASGREEKPSKRALTEIDKIDKNPLPACPHPWHEMYYLQRALASVLPDAVEARIEIYPAPLRLRLTRRDTGDMLDIPHYDLARIVSPDAPALATNVAAVIDTMLDVWADLEGATR